MTDNIIQRVFNKFDTENTGKISTEDFPKLISDLGYYLSEADTNKAIKKIDKNNDKKFSYEEFSDWWQSEDRFKKLYANSDKLQAWATYFKFDKYRTGELEGNEINQLHAELKKNHVTEKSLDDFLAEVDTKRDGKISFNEYVDWLFLNGNKNIE